jgi:hypothetical protein
MKKCFVFFFYLLHASPLSRVLRPVQPSDGQARHVALSSVPPPLPPMTLSAHPDDAALRRRPYAHPLLEGIDLYLQTLICCIT